MSVNYHKPYLKILPEDEADSDLALGFLGYNQIVNLRQVQLLPHAGGYPKVRAKFLEVHAKELRTHSNGHLVLLVDFDRKANRMEYFTSEIPEELKARVFVLGSWSNPEDLRTHGGLEKVGRLLAEDCHRWPKPGLWSDELLEHNIAEKQRMGPVRHLLFG